MRGHAQQQHPGMLQPLLDLGGDAVANGDLPLVEPDPQAVGPQSFRQRPHNLPIF